MNGEASLSSLVERAQETLRTAAVETDARSIGALVLDVLSLHGRVARALVSLPDVVGDDVPWSAIGDRDLYVSAVTGALTVQRGRIAALSDLRDPEGLLESCRLSLQTLATIVRDIERIYPVPSVRVRREPSAPRRWAIAGLRQRVVSAA